jgi:hypothetical protein
MKPITLMILFIATAALGQNKLQVSENGDPYFEVVHDFPGLSASQLYTKAKVWFAQSFKGGQKVITSDEKDLLIGATFVADYWNNALTTAPYRHSLLIRVKDGAAKIVVSNIESIGQGVSPSKWWVKDGEINYKGVNKKQVLDAEEQTNALAMSLKKGIESKDDF